MQIHARPPIVALGGNMFTYHEEVEDISIEEVYANFVEFYRIEDIETFNPTNQNISSNFHQNKSEIDKKRHENYLEGFYLNHQLPLSNEEKTNCLLNLIQGIQSRNLLIFFRDLPNQLSLD